MDEYAFHLKVWRILYALGNRWIRRKFNMRFEPLRVEGPVLLVPNHVNAWDPLLVTMSLKEKHVYFVASEHLFRLGFISRVIEKLVAPIPRRKASNGMDTVKACLRHLRAGHSICLFAEGEQCWDGRNIPIFPATGKLAKSSGATLVTYRLEGAYLSKPRWAKTVRRGAVYGHPVNVYPPEVLRTMTPDEINAAIERDTYENAWERQREKPVEYRGKKPAEGLERALCLCPRCRKVGTLRTEDERIFCGCGFSLRYLPTGFFEPAEPFPSIAEWDDWEKERLNARDFVHDGDLLFQDGEVLLTKIGGGHEEEKLPGGELRLYEDRLLCGERCFPLDEIENMAPVQTFLLLLSFGGEYYEIRSENGANLRKYVEIWKDRKR